MIFYLCVNVSRLVLNWLVWVMVRLCGVLVYIFSLVFLMICEDSLVEVLNGMIWLLLLCMISVGMLIFFRFLV